MLPRSFISLTLATLLSGCAASLPYTPSRLTNGIDRDAVQLNDAHTRATNGVITMNILRARDGWPTGYTTLSGVQFNPDVELDLTGNFTPLGLGNAPLPFGGSNASIARNEGADATYTVNPFAAQDGSIGLYNRDGTEEIFERFVKAGWPIEVIFPLMVQSVTVEVGGKDETCDIRGYGDLAEALNTGKTEIINKDGKKKKLNACLADVVSQVFKSASSVRWDYKIPGDNKNSWTCKPFGQAYLLYNSREESLSARISAINSAANGEQGKQRSRIMFEPEGVKLCSQLAPGTKKLVKGDESKAAFKDITFRSFDDMIYFVGETLRKSTVGDESYFKMCVEYCFDKVKPKRYLFEVQETSLFPNDYAVHVVHAKQNYVALREGLRKNGGAFDDRTGTVLAILSQILLFNQSESFLEGPENILRQ